MIISDCPSIPTQQEGLFSVRIGEQRELWWRTCRRKPFSPARLRSVVSLIPVGAPMPGRKLPELVQLPWAEGRNSVSLTMRR